MRAGALSTGKTPSCASLILRTLVQQGLARNPAYTHDCSADNDTSTYKHLPERPRNLIGYAIWCKGRSTASYGGGETFHWTKNIGLLLIENIRPFFLRTYSILKLEYQDQPVTYLHPQLVAPACLQSLYKNYIHQRIYIYGLKRRMMR